MPANVPHAPNFQTPPSIESIIKEHPLGEQLKQFPGENLLPLSVLFAEPKHDGSTLLDKVGDAQRYFRKESSGKWSSTVDMANKLTVAFWSNQVLTHLVYADAEKRKEIARLLDDATVAARLDPSDVAGIQSTLVVADIFTLAGFTVVPASAVTDVYYKGDLYVYKQGTTKPITGLVQVKTERTKSASSYEPRTGMVTTYEPPPVNSIPEKDLLRLITRFSDVYARYGVSNAEVIDPSDTILLKRIAHALEESIAQWWGPKDISRSRKEASTIALALARHAEFDPNQQIPFVLVHVNPYVLSDRHTLLLNKDALSRAHITPDGVARVAFPEE